MNKKIGLVLILFAIILLFLFLLDDNETESHMANQRHNSPSYNDKVSEHLSLTKQKIVNSEEKLRLELAKDGEKQGHFSESGGGAVHVPPGNNVKFDSYEQTRVGEELIEETGRGSVYDAFPDPQQLIQKEIFENQRQAEYDEAYRAAYAEKFIENARQRGWKVELDDQYRVKSVKPLRKVEPGPGIFNDRNPSGAR